MGAFAVLLHEEEQEANATLRDRIEEQFPGAANYKFNDNVYLIHGPKLVDEVMERLGIDDDESLYAAVLRLNGSYSGRSWRNMWDWFRAAEESR